MPDQSRPNVATPSATGVLTQVAKDIHGTALTKGFWDPPHPLIGEINTKLLLIVSEVSEAMEVLRLQYDDSPVNPYSQMTEFQGEDFVEEVADVIIRAFDLAYYFQGVHGNIADIILAKMHKNAGRPPKHGKRW